MSNKLDTNQKSGGILNASFSEKSVWIQLLSLIAIIGGYFVIAIIMLSKGVKALLAFVPLFIVVILLMIIVNITGHIVAAISNRPDGPDEHDRLIEWRAESNSAWLLGGGVLAAIAALVISIDNVWIVHLLLLSLFL